MRVFWKVEQRLGLGDDRDAVAFPAQPVREIGTEGEHILDHRLRRDHRIFGHDAGGDHGDTIRIAVLRVEVGNAERGWRG